ncbi:MAG: peptide deformylase [Treponema sp.]|nr:peptide deformylase [Treponema sp.]
MKVLHLGDERLRQISTPVTEVTDDLRATIEQMFELMLKSDGVGLAAPQVGIMQRFFVLIAEDNVKRVFINPQIIKTSTETGSFEEGCLSIPNQYETIVRPLQITVQALNEKGKPFTLEADGFLARIIQHEYDHLDGILYIDRGDPVFKFKVEKQFAERKEKHLAREKAKIAKATKIAEKKAAKATKKA